MTSRDTAEALSASWRSLSRHLEFQDMCTCLHVCTTVRKALSQTEPSIWRRAAQQTCVLPDLAVLSIQQVCCQVHRVLRSRSRLLGGKSQPSKWQQASKSKIVSAAVSPCCSWVAVVCSTHVCLLSAKDSTSAARVPMQPGWQCCTAAFSSDSRSLAVLSRFKRRRLQLRILDISTHCISSHTEEVLGSLSCQDAECWPAGCQVAVRYSSEDFRFQRHIRGLLINWQDCAVHSRVSLPIAWLMQPEPRMLQSRFSPGLSLIAAIPAAAPNSVAIHDAQSHDQLYSVDMQHAAGTLLWLNSSQVLVRGRETWLALVQIQGQQAGIKWTADVPRHYSLWPCLGAQALVLESRQALGDLAASRQLWLLDKATGLKRSIAGSLDLQTVRLQHCSMHPQGLAASLLYTTTGKSGRGLAVLLPLQGSADLDDGSCQLAEWQAKATAAPVDGIWSSDGTLHLTCHGHAAILHDFG